MISTGETTSQEFSGRDEQLRIAVCLITFRRPEGLRRLLEGLENLTFEKCDPPALEVVVVDNDPSGTARVFCEENFSDFRWPLRCYVEPRRGIPYARNKAVASISPGIDFVASLDDDEVPEPLWLDELLHAHRMYGADVVAGPVHPYFDEGVPDWVSRGRFFERRRHATGTPLKVAATNNVLVDARVFEEMDEHFSTSLGMTGSDDTHFFMRVHRAGYKMVWADKALVREWIPASRANARWLLQRAYSLGNRVTISELDIDTSVLRRLVRVLKATGRIGQGLLMVPITPVLGGRVAFLKALQRVCRGAGIFAGLAGKSYQEYRKIHGT